MSPVPPLPLPASPVITDTPAFRVRMTRSARLSAWLPAHGSPPGGGDSRLMFGKVEPHFLGRGALGSGNQSEVGPICPGWTVVCQNAPTGLLYDGEGVCAVWPVTGRPEGTWTW